MFQICALLFVFDTSIVVTMIFFKITAYQSLIYLVLYNFHIVCVQQYLWLNVHLKIFIVTAAMCIQTLRNP